MNLQGKKVVFLGDSITEGYGTSDISKVYWNVVAQKTGAICFGYGICGTRIAPQRVPSIEHPWEDIYFALRVDEMEPDADIVVVFGGTNDFGHGDAAFGKMTDRTNDTFFGACHLLMQKIMERYPDAKIVVMTPMHRVDEDETCYNDFGVRREGGLVRYVDAIKEVAGFYGAVVVDMFRTCPIQPTYDFHRQRFAPDGVHPNDIGHQLVAQTLLSTLETL